MKDHGNYSLVFSCRCLKAFFYGLGAGFVIRRDGSSADAADHMNVRRAMAVGSAAISPRQKN